MAVVLPAAGAVTGEWNFKFGDLRATIGADLQFINDTSNLTTFPTVLINGTQARVMAVGSNNPAQGFYLRHGAKANGGGHFVNQYSLVMDLFFPSATSGQLRAVFQSDPANPAGNDGEFYVGNVAGGNGLGANGIFSGSVPANTWCRIAWVVDLTDTNGQQLVTYINGVKAGMQSLPGGVDGRFALGPTAQLFTAGLTGKTQAGYVGGIAFWDVALSASAVAGLGGVSATGIPPAGPSLQFTKGLRGSSTVVLQSNGRQGLLELQTSTNLAEGWQDAGAFGSVGSMILPMNLTGAMFYSLVESNGVVDAGVPAEEDIIVNQLPHGEQSVPTKQILHAPSPLAAFGGRPVDVVLSHDGQLVYVKSSYGLEVIRVASWQVIQVVNYPAEGASMHGLTVTKDGSRVYATGCYNSLYEWVVGANGLLTFNRTIGLPQYCDPCGVVVTADGSTAYVCLSISNTLGVVDLGSGTLTKQIKVGRAPWDVVLSSNELTGYVSDWGGRAPKNGDLTGPSAGSAVVVDQRGIVASGMLSVVDLAGQQETAEVATGLHPSALLLSGDGGRLFVANESSDSVTMFDTRSLGVVETISTLLDARLPLGSAPGALAMSVDGTRLFVADGGNNAVGVYELPNGAHTNSVLKGFVPTDWYPGSVVVDATNLYVANVKGLGSRANQPSTSGYDVFNPTATANRIAIPSGETLDKFTAEVQEHGRLPQMLLTQLPAQAGVAPAPVPRHVGEPSVFEHVLYVIKENKTYDIVFGDMTNGNGMASLCTLPRFVSPNHHALADQFVLLDNFYCNGVQSTDGHAWCTEANANDYLEKAYQGYPRSGAQGTDALAISESGFIWNNVLAHGLSFTNFGEFSYVGLHPSGTWLQTYHDYVNHSGIYTYANLPALGALQPYSNKEGEGFNLGISDQIRVEPFLRSLAAAESNGFWPSFNILYLPTDHSSGATPGFPTPSAYMADNDLALGRAVEAVSHSRFWSNTVIFVIEDDALAGLDHVDGHRSICLVVSPYTKRGRTVSSFYNQCGVIRTMEQILGLPPISQFDAMAPLMTDCFTPMPDFTPYVCLAENLPLDTMNPGTTSSLSRKDAYWARLSQRMDFSKPDLMDEKVLSRIIWHAAKGDARYPAEFAGAHGKGLKERGLMLVGGARDEDGD